MKRAADLNSGGFLHDAQFPGDQTQLDMDRFQGKLRGFGESPTYVVRQRYRAPGRGLTVR